VGRPGGEEKGRGDEGSDGGWGEGESGLRKSRARRGAAGMGGGE